MMTKHRKKTIAITDDNSSVRMSIERTIKKHFQDIEILQFTNTIEIKKFLLDNPNKIDLLILDIYFGFGETGLDILPTIKEFSPNLPIILLSAMEKLWSKNYRYGRRIYNRFRVKTCNRN
jgi:DNA-binding NtrC family response regulator